jgi:hypothetical protein
MEDISESMSAVMTMCHKSDSSPWSECYDDTAGEDAGTWAESNSDM